MRKMAAWLHVEARRSVVRWWRFDRVQINGGPRLTKSARPARGISPNSVSVADILAFNILVYLAGTKRGSY